MHIVINIKNYCGLCENARNGFLVIIYLYFNFSESNFRGIQYPMNINEIDVLILQIMYLSQSNDKNDIVNFFMTEVVIYRNQSSDLQPKSMDWFLYDNGLRHERVKHLSVNLYFTIFFKLFPASSNTSDLIKMIFSLYDVSADQ